MEQKIKEIYQNDYLDALPEILSRNFSDEKGEPLFSTNNGERFTNLQQLLDSLTNNPELSNSENEEVKEKTVKTIIDNMSRMPAGQSMSVRHATETNEMFCSVSAATFQLIMEKIQSRLGVKSEYINPVDHAANIVKIANSQRERIFYADPRNGIFDDLTENITEENRDGLRIYRSKNGSAFSEKVLFSVIPAITDSAKAMVHADMGNFKGLVDFARGNFGEDSERMGIEIAHELQGYAKKYLEKLGILGDKEKEDAFTAKYAELEKASGKELEDFKNTEEFKTEEKRISVERVMSYEWGKIPDKIKKSLLEGDKFQTFLLNGDKNELSEVLEEKVLKSLEAIREAFGMRWIISDIQTDEDKIYDLKPFLERAKNSPELKDIK